MANEARTGVRAPIFVAFRSGGLDQPKLGQRGHAVVEADLLSDLAVEHFQHRGAGEVHFAAGRGRETADQKVVEGRACMGTAAFPLTDFFNNIRRFRPSIALVLARHRAPSARCPAPMIRRLGGSTDVAPRVKKDDLRCYARPNGIAPTPSPARGRPGVRSASTAG
jgi:hypothetical protein